MPNEDLSTSFRSIVSTAKGSVSKDVKVVSNSKRRSVTSLDTPKNPYESKLVLIVDQVTEMQRAMASILSSLGATKVEYASKASDALTKLSRLDFDIILSDYDLGSGYDGLNLLTEIRQRNLIKQSCVFIIVTGEKRTQRVIGAAEFAPDGYILKPFTGEKLRQKLDTAIYRKDAMKVVDYQILQQDYLAAIAECDKQIAKKDPHTIHFMKLKASLQLKIGDHLAAKAVYEQILSIKPLAWAQVGLAKCLTISKQYDEALEIFEKVLRENGNVMEAYDWIAKIHRARKDYSKETEITQKASELSPSVLHRQQNLGDAALLSGDYATAQAAVKKTIDIAKYSVYRCAEHYANLARIQRLSGDMKSAIETAGNIRREFRGDPVAKWMANLVESEVQAQSGNSAKARALFDQAVAEYESFGNLLSKEAKLELIHASYQQGREDIGQRVAEQLVKNNHDNDEFLDKVMTVFKLEGKDDLGRSLIEKNVQSVIDLNNSAVRLAQAGKLEDAISIFTRAVQDMPDNVQIMLNTVNAILGFIYEKGWHDTYSTKAQEYLERVKKLDPINGKYQKLVTAFRGVVKKNNKQDVINI